MATATQEREEVRVQLRPGVEPWGIEADAPRNNDLLIQSVPGCRLRGAVDSGKPIVDAVSGTSRIPADQAAYLGLFPPMPGMQIHVNPEKLSYTVIDPLDGDEDLCEKIRQGMNELGPFRVKGKIKGVPPRGGKLDKHAMKTLVREMVRIVDAGEGKVVKGVKPAMAAVDALPGRYLLNPGSYHAGVPNAQPRFEDDFDAWLEGSDKRIVRGASLARE